MQVKPALTLAGGAALSALALRAVACASFGTADGTIASPNEAGTAPNELAPDTERPEASTTFCATQDASFCADFDEDPDAAAGWTSIRLSPDGVISETAIATSGPSAFSSRVGDGGGEARLLWRFPPRAYRTTLSFDIKVVRGVASIGTSQAIAELDCVNWDDAGPRDWGGLWLAGGGAASAPNLQVTAGAATFPMNDFPEGWSHVEIAVDWGRTRSNITITTGSGTLIDAGTTETCIQKSDAFLLLGVASDLPNELLFDNVVVDVRLDPP